MAEIYLVRHGQSLNNALGEDGRVADPALTEVGTKQAENLRETLAELSADTFLVSGFRRALETADPFARHHNVSFQVWRELHEVGGCYAGQTGQPKTAEPGMTPACVRKYFQWAEPEMAWTEGGWNRLQNHESVEEALPRVERMAKQLEEHFAATDQKVVIVSHGEFISLLLARFTGVGRPFFVRPRSIYNTAITQLNLTSDGCQLIEFNRVCHLSDGQLTS